METRQRLKDSILQLKKEKRAVILAHYYQEPEIQELADFVGDSLALSKMAAETDAEIIVFAGVHFMAETASILNPDKKVIVPDLAAGCSLADSCPPDKFKAFLTEYPQHTVVSYINCSAEVKAMSDIICTSANALNIVNSIPPEEEIIFAPDKNLGHYLSEKTGRPLLLWEGTCEVHDTFSLEKIQRLRQRYPEARLIVHPEASPAVIECADFVGSTKAMIAFVEQNEATCFIVATEVGILHEMRRRVAHKKLIAAPVFEDNTCACSVCPHMKKNTLEKLHQCLAKEEPEVAVGEPLRQLAMKPLQAMLTLS